MRPIHFLKGVCFLLAAMLLLTSCGSYSRKIQKYYSKMEAGRYHAAFNSLDHIDFLQKERNRFLYFAEKGRMAHLMGLYDSSNDYLNAADQIAELRFKSTMDVVAGTLLNPMMQTYHGESFERFMVHFYKALNYSFLGDTENALVEARRLNIALVEHMDGKKGSSETYSKDAFSLNLQGMIYEMAGDVNNAFIAYRNAAETYLLADEGRWYGVTTPRQLKYDLLRTAEANGFYGELERYERLYNLKYEEKKSDESGELIIFIENGQAPVKQEENLMFMLVQGAGGNFYFTDPTGGFSIPFDSEKYASKQTTLSNLRSFRIALPRYYVTSPAPQHVRVTVNEKGVAPELVQDINTVALETMRENRFKDITNALTRLVVKKLAEAGARSAARSLAENKTAKSDETEKEKKKREDDAEAVGAAVGLIFQAFSMVSEKADTRNWQSLPAYIQYVRVGLDRGVNHISVDISGTGKDVRTFQVEGRNGIQFLNVR